MTVYTFELVSVTTRQRELPTKLVEYLLWSHTRNINQNIGDSSYIVLALRPSSKKPLGKWEKFQKRALLSHKELPFSIKRVLYRINRTHRVVIIFFLHSFAPCSVFLGLLMCAKYRCARRTPDAYIHTRIDTHSQRVRERQRDRHAHAQTDTETDKHTQIHT